jgi:hypothetical protein
MLPLIAAFELAGRIAFAQTESNPAAQLRACSPLLANNHRPQPSPETDENLSVEIHNDVI